MSDLPDVDISQEEQEAAIKTMSRAYMGEGVPITEIDNLLYAAFPTVARVKLRKLRREAFKDEALSDETLIKNMGEHRAYLFEMHRTLFFKAMASGKIGDARQILKDLTALLGMADTSVNIVSNTFNGPTGIGAAPPRPAIEQSDMPAPLAIEPPVPIDNDNVFEAEVLNKETVDDKGS